MKIWYQKCRTSRLILVCIRRGEGEGAGGVEEWIVGTHTWNGVFPENNQRNRNGGE